MNTWKFLFVVAALGCGADRVETVAPKAPIVVLYQPSDATPSVDDQRVFWDDHLHQHIVGELMAGQHAVSEVNARFLELRRVVESATGNQLHLDLVTNYDPKIRAVRAGASIKDSVPIISLIIPSIMNEFREFEQSGRVGWLDEFRLSVVVSIMHEMEHLASYSYAEPDHEHLVSEEVSAWHATCEYTLAPLVERYGLEIGQSASVYYQIWLQADRGKSPEWEASIREIYKQVGR